MAQSSEIKLNKRFDQNIEITGTLTVGGNSVLTSYTETDPIFSASAASGITSTNISNWNTAYNWGNHANAGYLTSVPVPNLQAVTDVNAVTTRTIQADAFKSDLIQSASQASESFIDLDDDVWFAGAVTNVLTLSSKSHMVFVNDTNSNGTTENFSFYTQGTTDANATKLFEIQQGGNVVAYGNIIAEDAEVHVGDVSGDSWTRIKHAQADGYGFDWTHNNATVIVNEQGTTNEALVLGDVNTASTDSGLFGISYSTDGGANWTKKLDLRGNGDLYVGSSGTTKVLTTDDEGSGNGIDADTVDGLQASQFLRSDADDTATGTVTFENGIRIGTGSHGTSANTAAITFGEGSPTSDSMYLEYDGEGLSGDNNALFIRTAKDGSTLASFTYGGNVGIGTTSPAQKLDVAGDIRMGTSGVGSTLRINRPSDGVDAGQVGFFSSTSNTPFGISNGSGGGDIELKSNNGSLRFYTGVSQANQVFRITNSGNVGIGTTSPAVPLHVNGFARFNGGIQLDGNNRTIYAIDNTSLILGTNNTERMRIDSAGNVGIGTTSPQTKLHVTDAITISDVGGTNNVTLIQFTESNNYDQFAIKGDFAGAGGENKLKFTTDLGGGDILTLKGDGNVGIGTTSPLTKLHIVGNSSFPQVRINDDTGGGESGIRFRSNNGTDGLHSDIFIQRTGNETGRMGFRVPYNQERLTILHTGNVGIGTTSPDRKLHIVSNLEEVIRIDASGNSGAIHFRENGAIRGLIGFSNGSSIYTGADDQDMVLRSEQKLHLISNSSNNGITISAGNVGIGTTTPDDKLDVDGRIRARQGFSGTDGSAKEYFWHSNNTGNSGTIWRKIGTYNPSGQSSRIMITAVGTASYGAGNRSGKTTIVAQVNNNNLLEGNFWQEGMATQYGAVGFVSNSATSHDIYYQIASYSEFAFEAIISDGTFTPDATTVSTPTFTRSATREWNVNAYLWVKDGGNVGIGTTTPEKMLQLGQSDGTNQGSLRIYHDGSGEYVDYNGYGMVFNRDYNYIRPSQVGGRVLLNGTSTHYWTEIQNHSNEHNWYVAGDSFVMRINSSGNVGIGTTSPSDKLDVNGTANFTSHIKMQESHFINLRFDIADNANNVQYILLCRDAGSNDVNGTITMDRTSGLRHACRVDILISAGSSDLPVGGLRAFGTAEGGDPEYKLVKCTYNSVVYIALQITNPDYYYESSGAYFTGRLVSTGESLLPLLPSQVSSVSDFENNTEHVFQGNVGFRDGNVGVRNTNPNYDLDVTGTIRASGDVIAYSDARVKENVKTIDNALDKVTQLRGVSYNKIGETEEKIGVIAQEIEKVLPQVVQEDDEGMKSVAYGNIVGVLIEAVKELSNKVEELENKLNGTEL